MRVLWLSFTAAGASKTLKNEVAGCGWIASLEECIKRVPGLKLGVAFFNETSQSKFEIDDVAYYPIEKKYRGFQGKLEKRIFSKLYDTNPKQLKAAIDDFKPDVIHLFGTESGMVEVLEITTIPTIVHLQGLVRPYLSMWFPKGMSQRSVWLNSSIRALVLRRGVYFEYPLFKKRALREDKAIRKAKYFFGRTAWDKNYISFLKEGFEYFHCEEVLRPIFNEYHWERPENKTIKIVSVINPQLYKGIEMVLETAKLLKERNKVDFEWSIIGIGVNDELVSIIEKFSNDSFAANNVVFTGKKMGKELVDELLNAHFFVHPSHIDNSPNSVCEAMLLGMPVFAGNVGGVSSLIANNIDGLLYNSYDAAELAGLVLKSFSQMTKMEFLGKNARLRAQKRHDNKTITNTVINAYKSIIQFS